MLVTLLVPDLVLHTYRNCPTVSQNLNQTYEREAFVPKRRSKVLKMKYFTQLYYLLIHGVKPV
jgi:hypothetical protein